MYITKLFDVLLSPLEQTQVFAQTTNRIRHLLYKVPRMSELFHCHLITQWTNI